MQFVAGLGHADVEHLLILFTASQNEVHSQRRFAGARPAFDEVKTAEDKAAAEDVVQTRQPGGRSIAPAQSSHSRDLVRGATGTPMRPPALFRLLSHLKNRHLGVSFNRTHPPACR
jgi:hypothetical protein